MNFESLQQLYLSGTQCENGLLIWANDFHGYWDAKVDIENYPQISKSSLTPGDLENEVTPV